MISPLQKIKDVIYSATVLIVDQKTPMKKHFLPKTEAETAISKFNLPEYGELDIPDRQSIDIARASHQVLKIETLDSGEIVVTIKIINTPLGVTVSSLLENNIKLYLAMRATGKLITDLVGVENVISELEIITFDIVAKKSEPCLN
jgi:hypothetical protein